jgi:hypothetical protein
MNVAAKPVSNRALQCTSTLENLPLWLRIRTLFVSLQLRLKPTEVIIGLSLVTKESLLKVPRTEHEILIHRRIMLLGLDHLVHALAEAGEACVLSTHGDASHLSRRILVGADAALPSVADGGGAV